MIYVVADLCETLTSDLYKRWAAGYALLICTFLCILKVTVNFHCFVCAHNNLSCDLS